MTDPKATKTIADEWVLFEKQMNFGGLEKAELLRVQDAFYHGAVAMLHLITNMNQPNPDDPAWEAHVSDRLDLIIAEADSRIEWREAVGKTRQ